MFLKVDEIPLEVRRYFMEVIRFAKENNISLPGNPLIRLVFIKDEKEGKQVIGQYAFLAFRSWIEMTGSDAGFPLPKKEIDDYLEN